MERGRWNPWATLRANRSLLFDLVDLDPDEGDGFYWPLTTGEAVIGVGRHLDQAGRNAVLAHELTHHAHGGGRACAGMPSTWDDLVVREENAIDAEVAARLVPKDELRAMRDRQEDLGQTLEAWQVAEEFGVPERVAVLAMEIADRQECDEKAG